MSNIGQIAKTFIFGTQFIKGQVTTLDKTLLHIRIGSNGIPQLRNNLASIVTSLFCE